MSVARRLNKIEAALAPGLNDELRAQLEQILAAAPPLRALTLEERNQADQLANAVKLRAIEPKRQIELAQRLVRGRRRLFVDEHGQGALEAWDAHRTLSDTSN